MDLGMRIYVGANLSECILYMTRDSMILRKVNK